MILITLFLSHILFHLFLINFAATGPFNCDFETNFCQYLKDGSAQFNWTRSQGYTHSAGTGPGYDHTIGKGAVGPRGPGSLVQIGGKCLHVLNGAWTKPANDQPLVTYDGCGQQRLEFQLLPNGQLKHTLYGQCVRPKGGLVADGTEVSSIFYFADKHGKHY